MTDSINFAGVAHTCDVVLDSLRGKTHDQIINAMRYCVAEGCGIGKKPKDYLPEGEHRDNTHYGQPPWELELSDDIAIEIIESIRDAALEKL